MYIYIYIVKNKIFNLSHIKYFFFFSIPSPINNEDHFFSSKGHEIIFFILAFLHKERFFET